MMQAACRSVLLQTLGVMTRVNQCCRHASLPDPPSETGGANLLTHLDKSAVGKYEEAAAVLRDAGFQQDVPCPGLAITGQEVRDLFWSVQSQLSILKSTRRNMEFACLGPTQSFLTSTRLNL